MVAPAKPQLPWQPALDYLRSMNLASGWAEWGVHRILCVVITPGELADVSKRLHEMGYTVGIWWLPENDFPLLGIRNNED